MRCGPFVLPGPASAPRRTTCACASVRTGVARAQKPGVSCPPQREFGGNAAAGAALTVPPPHPVSMTISYVRELALPDHTRQQHARAALRGEEQRVSRGAYVTSALWAESDLRARYLLRVRAVGETRQFRPVLSHWSAAAIHGLPIIGDWPEAVHITVGPTSGGRSRGGVVKHSLDLRDDEVVDVDDQLVTSVARTVVDLAVVASFRGAVVLADHCLHVDRFDRMQPLLSRDELANQIARRMPFRGHARARAVERFATAKADSPLESVSRVTMHEIGCPPPQLQTPFHDAEGFIAETDFYWEEVGLIGEADGDQKYLDAAKRSGRTIDQVKLDEKVREDRLRALPRGVTRWRWATAISPVALHRHLSGAGIVLPRLRR